ncbi:MAG TPA: DUF6474 family protein, partial [Pseudonocardia sp.]
MGLRRRSGDEARSADPTATSVPDDETAAPEKETKEKEKGRRRKAKDDEAEADHGRRPLTAARAKRLIGVSKAVAPLLAPYALAIAGVARARWDAHRAARLGVDPSQLSAY